VRTKEGSSLIIIPYKDPASEDIRKVPTGESDSNYGILRSFGSSLRFRQEFSILFLPTRSSTLYWDVLENAIQYARTDLLLYILKYMFPNNGR
jgi:hypothetical protein